MTALHEDRELLGRFLRELVGVKPPCHTEQLTVLEQQYPDQLEPSDDENELRSVPDGWIFHGDWCVLLESKVTASLTAEQMKSHRRSAERQEFRQVTAVAIVAHCNVDCPPDTVLLAWRKVYAWLRAAGNHSAWGARAARYLEIAEAQLITNERFFEGTLTMFAGIPFNREFPFAYVEGKRILKLARDELRGRADLARELGVIADAPGRGAIRGRLGDHVWDFLSLWKAQDGKSFTKYPHLTLGINTYEASAMVTIPNAVDGAIRRNIARLDEGQFQKLVHDIVTRLGPLLRKEPGAVPWFSGWQRRWPSINAQPYLDARIEFDLRTAVPGTALKFQQRWLSAGYGTFVIKGGANYEMQIGVKFPYGRCSKLGQPESIDMFAEAWMGCRPLIDLARG